MTTNQWENQADQIIEQGKKVAAGMAGSGELLIDADPQGGFFRVKLRNVQPPALMPQFISAFCQVLVQSSAMFNLQVKHHVRSDKNEQDE